jgi:hypothetical protein
MSCTGVIGCCKGQLALERLDSLHADGHSLAGHVVGELCAVTGPQLFSTRRRPSALCGG